MFYTISGIISIAIWATLMFALFNSFFERKANWSNKKILILLAADTIFKTVTTVIITGEYFDAISISRSIIATGTAIIFVGVLSIPFKGHVVKKGFFTMFFFVISSLFETVGLVILAAINRVTVIEIMEIYAGSFILRDAGIFLLIIVVPTIIVFRKKVDIAVNSFGIYFLESLIMISSIIIMVFSNFFVQPTGYFFIFAFVILINFIAFFVYIQIEKYYAKNQALALQNQQYRLQEEYYKDLKDNQNEIRMFNHDIDNKFIVLNAYAQSNDKANLNHQIDSMLNMLEKNIKI